jgi:hypothetical protein
MNEECIKCRHACKGVHTLFTSQRERERERETERGREREGKKEREKRGGERQIERDVELSRIVVFIFKRDDRCIGTF